MDGLLGAHDRGGVATELTQLAGGAAVEPGARGMRGAETRLDPRDRLLVVGERGSVFEGAKQLNGGRGHMRFLAPSWSAAIHHAAASSRHGFARRGVVGLARLRRTRSGAVT